MLVNPGVAMPTPAVFGARNGPFSAPARLSVSTIGDVRELAALLKDGRGNDLALVQAQWNQGRVRTTLSRELAQMGHKVARIFALRRRNSHLCSCVAAAGCAVHGACSPVQSALSLQLTAAK